MLRLLIVLWTLSGQLYAASDIRGSADSNLLERFPRSFIVQYEEIKDHDYRLVLGGLEKINGVLAPEKQQLINGDLTRITYRIPDNHTPDEAFESFTRQLQALSAERLFHCVGRECGSSNQWANNILKYSRLYGVDKTQQFSASKLRNTYISLYSVRRGNKRVYLRLDLLESALMDLSEALISGVQTELLEQEAELSQISDFLKENVSKRIWIISHDNQEGGRQEQLDRSIEAAEAFRKRLIASGVSEERVLIHSLGGFSAAGNESISGISVVTEDM
ncbi:DUF4892 domain-containing protein [Neptuniibacter caesariensis]|uniref:OmpA-like domain-containing protein n=1 Tax=Neptuniibacter caesariensis TaxID=207954 RepID=A0A7U8GSY8_NEPCE|nr:DUF4892 domain-containing protein [Neptuniibacter caesariensis]EAR61732.1 hypothetical protein MED92_04017 [Neptuniibacter caesariensis]